MKRTRGFVSELLLTIETICEDCYLYLKLKLGKAIFLSPET